jgi:hypothetical protein
MSGENSQVFSSGKSLAVTFSLFFLCSVKACKSLNFTATKSLAVSAGHSHGKSLAVTRLYLMVKSSLFLRDL